MILFFLLAGFIAKESVQDLGLRDFVKSRLASRFVPFIFFNLLLALLSLACARLSALSPGHPRRLSDRHRSDLHHASHLRHPDLVPDEPDHGRDPALRRLPLPAIVRPAHPGRAVVFYLAGYALNREVQFFQPASR